MVASWCRRVLRLAGAARAASRAVRSAGDELERDPQGAVRGALVRHRRDRPRRALARDLGSARLAARRARLGVDLARVRRSASACWPGYAGGWADALISRMTDADAGLPVPDPRHRARGIPGTEPHQRDDRDRRIGDADLHPPDARAGARRSRSRTTSRRRARSATRHCASRCATSCPTSCPPLIVQATLAIAAASSPRPPVVPRPGPAAAGAELGQHAQHRQELSSTTRRGWRCGRDYRSSCWCCRSTCSATACATRSTPGSDDYLPRAESPSGKTSLAQSLFFQFGTGVAQPACGTKLERSTSANLWM